MSKNLPDMLENTIAKIREMVDVNSVIGTPITTADGVTIIPVSKVSAGFGGGAGGGVSVTPIAFLIVKEGNVRMMPVATPANTTADRLVEMIPDTLDKVSAFIDSHSKKNAE